MIDHGVGVGICTAVEFPVQTVVSRMGTELGVNSCIATCPHPSSPCIALFVIVSVVVGAAGAGAVALPARAVGISVVASS